MGQGMPARRRRNCERRQIVKPGYKHGKMFRVKQWLGGV
jgi:hypothetical protein